MYWNDYKTEKPESQTLCFVEFEDVIHKPYYRVLKYVNREGAAWMSKFGECDDGKTTTRWVYLYEVTERIKDKPRMFSEVMQANEDNFKDRLGVEYWQLSNRIEKLEKALITFDCLDNEQKELLHEQRKAMLAYKDVLFRRCCLNNVDLYKS